MAKGRLAHALWPELPWQATTLSDIKPTTPASNCKLPRERDCRMRKVLLEGMSSSHGCGRRPGRVGFSLIELLVVIAIVAVLASLLFPVMTSAKQKARQSNCIANLRQLGSAVQMYAADCAGYPRHSSPSSVSPRTRWADYIMPYVKNNNMFSCPSTREAAILSKPFAHNTGIMYGGYGYNYQYLGNARSAPGLPFTATDAMITAPSHTVAIADSDGVLNTDGTLSGDGVYVVDPPLTCARGSGKSSGYYGDATFANGGRAMPAERHNGSINVSFADGHTRTLKLSRLDDYNNDGIPDNGFWNGRRDPHSP